MRLFTRTVFVFVLLIALNVTGSLVAAQEEMKYPTILLDANGLSLPDTWVTGITTIAFENDTETTFSPVLLRLVEGATMEDFIVAMQKQDFNTVLKLVKVLGAPEVPTGKTLIATYDLAAGNYIFGNFVQNVPPMLRPFTIAENDGHHVEAPTADVEVDMVDFAFAMPTELTSEDAIWKVANGGEQPHEIVIYKVDAGAQVDELMQTFLNVIAAAEPGTTPEFPFEKAYMWTGMSPGETAWFEPNLVSGTYVALCVIPDQKSKSFETHLAHGMIVMFTVSK